MTSSSASQEDNKQVHAGRKPSTQTRFNIQIQACMCARRQAPMIEQEMERGPWRAYVARNLL